MRRRRRRVVLVSAIISTVLAFAMVVFDNGPLIGKAVERVAWSVSPIQAVTDLAADSDYNSFDLTWGASDQAESYTVNVASDAAMKHIMQHVTTPATRFAMSGLPEGTTYYYRVSWVSKWGNKGALSLVKPVTTAFHSVAAPADVAVSATASVFSVSWATVEWATSYVVRMSLSKDPAQFGVSPADLEFPPTEQTELTTPAIAPAPVGQKFYFTVRAANHKLSHAVSAPANGRLLLAAPRTASAVGASTNGVTVTWSRVPDATSYVIDRSFTPDFTTIDGSYSVPKAYAKMSVNGLAAGTGYFLRVRAQMGSLAGEGSAAIAATTRSAPTTNLRVATYNILDPALGKKSLAPWDKRRKNVARTIDAANADIIALEEASWSKVKGNKTAVKDLMHLVKKKKKLSKAGSRGDEILYSGSKFKAGKHGSFALPKAKGDGKRVGIYQVFTVKKTGARFIVVATHLTSGSENDAARVKQANAIVKKLKSINKSGLPLVLMGDLNSYDKLAPETPMSRFADAGYSDAELSTPFTATPTLNTWVKSTSVIGTVRFDHIAVTSSISVRRTEIENPALKGPASDHRLLWADIAIARH